MSFLKRLAELSAGLAPTVQPRLPVRFETPLRSPEAPAASEPPRQTGPPRSAEPMISSEPVEMGEERVRIPRRQPVQGRSPVLDREAQAASPAAEQTPPMPAMATQPLRLEQPPFAFEASRETMPLETAASSDLLPRADREEQGAEVDEAKQILEEGRPQRIWVERIGTERAGTSQLKTIEPNLVVLRDEEPESKPSKDSGPALVQPLPVHAAPAPKPQFGPDVRAVRQVQPKPDPEQVIRISIGTIEIRAASEPAPPPVSATPSVRPQSLDDYLKRYNDDRFGGGRP